MTAGINGAVFLDAQLALQLASKCAENYAIVAWLVLYYCLTDS